MTSDSSEWDEDLPADPEEEYQTFVRTLERTAGFRLLFVRCTPAEGEQLFARVKDDLPQKTLEFCDWISLLITYTRLLSGSRTENKSIFSSFKG
jgi:hypothetical protein